MQFVGSQKPVERSQAYSGSQAQRCLLALFSALTGLAIGALFTVVVFDHYLERDFKDSIQLMGWDWSCTTRDGFISDQDNGRYCVFQISE